MCISDSTRNSINNFFVCCLLLNAIASVSTGRNDEIDFQREISPLISRACIRCHGPEEQEGGLRLDDLDFATEAGDSGTPAITPFDANASEVIRRITSDDPELQMPPPGEEPSLSEEQIATIQEWIQQGAQWEQHWSFKPIVRPEIPRHELANINQPINLTELVDQAWRKNEIDYFVLEKLHENKFPPSPIASRNQLLRRITLDLIGINPSLDELKEFLADNSPNAYEKVVDRLLASPLYGERFATTWLDLARYADTNGHFMDNKREMWAWRDWVVNALNDNMPFDQFTIEQLAGDLLPNPTRNQLIATGFNRNHGLNFEAGAIDEECRVSYVIDRVNTTSMVWMGLTAGCAQCHNHMYDPISQKEYFQLYAFFNNVEEDGLAGHFGNAEPMISLPTRNQESKLQSLELAESKLNQLQVQSINKVYQDLAKHEHNYIRRSVVEIPEPIAYFPFDESGDYIVTDEINGLEASIGLSSNWTRGRYSGGLILSAKNAVDLEDSFVPESDSEFTVSCWIFPETMQDEVLLARMANEGGLAGFDISVDNGRIVVRLASSTNQRIEIESKEIIGREKWQHVAVAYDGRRLASGFSVFVNGKRIETTILSNNLGNFDGIGVSTYLGRRYLGGSFNGIVDEVRIFDVKLKQQQIDSLSKFDPAMELLDTFIDYRSDDDDARVAELVAEQKSLFYRPRLNELCKVLYQKRRLESQIASTMVMQERSEPRQSYVLHRGLYDTVEEEVEPNTPAFLPPLERKHLYQFESNEDILADSESDEPPRLDRLALARWLVQPNHPLTSRVVVNRAWQHFFGNGLVRTPADFGKQGDRPTHPELLDWLAADLLENRWDTKRLHKQIVMSATYQQASAQTGDQLNRDPTNKWLSRTARRRLSAEVIRDSALSNCGILSPIMGGPSVFPYQPAGLWKELSFRDSYEAQEYKQSSGESLYRRSLYTFWKRTSPPPSLSVFDAPSREFCQLQRGNAGSPLQSLVTLNDPTYIETARLLAEQVLLTNTNNQNRIKDLYQVIFTRLPENAELETVLDLLNSVLQKYKADRFAAENLIQVGESVSILSETPSKNAGLQGQETQGSKMRPQEALAAWTVVVSTLMNLDEAITRE